MCKYIKFILKINRSLAPKYVTDLILLKLYFSGPKEHKDHYHIDLNDDVVRGSIILHKGEMMWPPPKIVDPTPPASKVAAAAVEVIKEEPNYLNDKLKETFMYTAGLGGMLGKIRNLSFF